MINKNNNIIANWLILGAFLVLLMVLIGGITRLTHSGLSIVTWQPIKGILPPLNEVQWQEAFDAYKKIPEYQRVHHYFELDDFKKIYFWEYIHRVLGRFLGLAFIIPFLYFYFTKKISNTKLLLRLLLIFFLGGIQGFAGWYMVKSGLVERTSVDHYRLALHMFIALIVLTTIFWTILQLKFPNVGTNLTSFKRSIMFVTFLTGLQIIYGGFTAGLKAGYVFPTFPKMGEKWIPDIIFKMYHETGVTSFFEFPASVQFIHRWFGLVIVLLTFYYFLKWKNKLPLRLKKIMLAIVLIFSLQYTLGVLTILFKVHIILAVTHQITAFLLFLALLSAIYFSSPRKNVYQT